MTVADSTRCRPAGPGPGPAPGSGCSGSAWTPTGPSSRACKERIEGYQRRVEERVARARRRGRLRRARRHRAGRPRGGRPLRVRAGRPRALPRRHLRHLEHGAARSSQAAKAPVVLLGLQPTATLDYANTDTGEWLANCAACCVPEIAGAFTRARIPYDTVAGTIDDDERAWAKIGAWVRAAGVARALRRVAHRLPRATPIRACSTCTPTSPPCTPSSARTSRCSRSTTSARASRRRPTTEVAAKVDEIRAMFAFADPSADPIAGPIEPEQLDWSARVAVGLDRLAADFELDALTYYYRGVDGNEAERLGAGVIVGNSLLTARGDPDRGRGRPQDQHRAADPRPARRRRLLHRVLRARLRRGLRPDGPRRARRTSRSRRSSRRCARSSSTTASAAPGLSVEFKVRYGPVTIVGCTQTADGRAEAASSARASRSRARRSGSATPTAACASALPPAEFFERWCAEGPTHHVALGVGHVARRGAQGRVAARPRVRARWAEVERVCFLLRVRPDRLDEYRARHRAVWPEMLDALRATGWGNYSLFLADDGLLVGYLETEDFDGRGRRHGGDRRQRALAGGDGASSSSCPRASGPTPGCSASRRSSTLPEPRATPRSTSARRAAASSPAACGRRASTLEEVHRFPNRPVRLPGRPALEPAAPVHRGARGAAPRRAASTASASTPGASTTRCSTSAAACSGCPFHYRDARTAGMVERAFARVAAGGALRGHRHPDDADQHRLPAARRRGLGRARRRRAARARARPARATGCAASCANESTNASTTGLLDARSGDWARDADRAARAARRGSSARSSSPARRSAPLLAHHELGRPRRSTPSPATTPRRPSPPRRCATSTPRSSRAAPGRCSGSSCPSRCSATRRARRTSPTSAASTARRGCSRT